MKHIIGVLMLTGLLFSCRIPRSASGKLKEVKVTDWGQKSHNPSTPFWQKVEKEIVQQIGQQAFSKVKFFSDNKNIPVAFQLWDGNPAHNKVDFQEWKKRLSSLRIYKYVEFNYTFRDSTQKHTVLAVPFQKLYWAPSAKWDTVYFVINSKMIEAAN